MAWAGSRQRCAAVSHAEASIRVESCKLGIAVRCRSWRDAAAFDGLSALTQLTRLATNCESSTQCEAQYSQLAQLTGLRELDAPSLLQTDGGKAVPPTLLHQTLHICAPCSLGVLLAC